MTFVSPLLADWAVSRILDSYSLVCWSGSGTELVAVEGFGRGAVAEGRM